MTIHVQLYQHDRWGRLGRPSGVLPHSNSSTVDLQWLSAGWATEYLATTSRVRVASWYRFTWMYANLSSLVHALLVKGRPSQVLPVSNAACVSGERYTVKPTHFHVLTSVPSVGQTSHPSDTPSQVNSSLLSVKENVFEEHSQPLPLCMAWPSSYAIPMQTCSSLEHLASTLWYSITLEVSQCHMYQVL